MCKSCDEVTASVKVVIFITRGLCRASAVDMLASLATTKTKQILFGTLSSLSFKPKDSNDHLTSNLLSSNTAGNKFVQEVQSSAIAYLAFLLLFRCASIRVQPC